MLNINQPINILVLGASGQLGSELNYLSKDTDEKSFNFIFVTRNELDITNEISVSELCQSQKIDVMVNCAAYTAVDKAESDIEQADAINHHAVKNLAQIAKDQNISLVHISTDYVFDGTHHKPYVETDETNPKSNYGKTKLDGELAIQAINPENSIIIRTSWVYSEFGNNFVKTMLRLGAERDELNVVCDQIGSPTNARDLAEVIISIIPQLKNTPSKNVELYHFSNDGVCSWFDFCKSIFELNDINCKVTPIPSTEYPTPAARPYYSVMNNKKLFEHFKLPRKHWRESLKAFKTDKGN